ncbi:bifunctional aspartate kinase/homoserine dehydrogenase I [Blochmannia endosymbiont of Colobopsis nipponica]|uniref:bifunctional aspartate kinase/homoserine dehydrogenase I n=1 Tax=Blochmannia endosymbiont of Colobopsis nipponica TaxID=2681987 RepID=UPI00177CB443|nr:bifunctional aspartate kinase/homoserine dehydrogenase I [Blochmannia endosymbiont of Colobopsis nipponica]QOI11295.1 bifunctional aspartate kinase/homoserine dehydrogenase I [Blochmannia endosymbiont of Colobopsis nipponica]
MRVLKFGGTSVANAKCFVRVANILETYVKQGQVAVVLSAPAKITNHLITMINKTLSNIDFLSDFHDVKKFFLELSSNLMHLEPRFNYLKLNDLINQEFTSLEQLLYGISLLKYCPDSINATIICLGEKLSIFLMQELLISRGFGVTVIDPVEKLLAYGSYLASMVDIRASTKRIQTVVIPIDAIILMAGFTAGNERGELVALGRNGSDYSAAVLAACLRATCCEIWTDVDGVYTCDPRQVPDAQLLRFLSYEEAMELSYFGAQVLHPRTISPIAQFRIPCLIKNITNIQAPGTLIGPINNKEQNLIVKGITYLKNLSLINVSGHGMKGMIGMAARVFAAISRVNCSVVLITQSSSEYSISFCIYDQDLSAACKVLEEEFYLELKNNLLNPLSVTTKLAIISIVGNGMCSQPGLLTKFFGALSSVNIDIIAIAQGSSERSISVVVNDSNTVTGVRVVHQALFNHNQIIEVFIIGIGGVGCALIKQIYRQYNWLKNKHIDLRVCCIANSRIMRIDTYGLDLSNWQNFLIENGSYEITNLDKIIALTTNHYLFNPVIVDCTSSVKVAKRYVDFLTHGFHVVTSNKKGNTSSMEYYRKIRAAVLTSHRKFLYDTNVGAGLPVIDNLQNLLNAGDELMYFSGILSGSLSFIFGKLDEGMSLSEATRIARQRGYTEPDPREDLSGIDVARKLLILAREVGCQLELKDIYVKSVLPINFDVSGDVDSFLRRLSFIDHDFLTKVSLAHDRGCVLRYVGSIREKKYCQVKTEFVDNDNPLFKVKNGENALAFFTRYYQPLPLVLRGYGAGNDVTAAGIFADLLRTLSSPH